MAKWLKMAKIAISIEIRRTAERKLTSHYTVIEIDVESESRVHLSSSQNFSQHKIFLAKNVKKLLKLLILMTSSKSDKIHKCG